jgi:hypothetical protein
MDDIKFQVSCVVATVLGISLLLAGPVLSLNAVIAVPGFLLLGAGGPFVFVFLGRHVHGPQRSLVYNFGYALPGAALVSIGMIIRHLYKDLSRPVLTMLGIAMIFGAVWLFAFIAWGIAHYEIRRNKPHDLDTEDVEYRVTEDRQKRRFTFYETVSLVVALLGTVAGVFSDVITLAR